MIGMLYPPLSSAAPTLLLNPLVDVFAVLVMFLTFAFSVTDGAPLSDIRLPVAHGQQEMGSAPRLAISRTSVRVQGTTTATLDAEAPDLMQAVFAALQREKLALISRARFEAALWAEAQAPDALVVEATRGLPFGQVERLMHTAEAAGFHDFALLVEQRP